MGDRLDQFILRHAVVERALQMKRKLVRPVASDERSDRDETAITRTEAGAFPHVAEEHFVGVLRERGSDVAKGFPGIGGCFRHSIPPRHRFVLRIGDFLHPLDDLSVEQFLNRDVRHTGGRRRAVPVLHARWRPDDISWTDFFDRAAPMLHTADAGGHNEHLAAWMGVPRRTRACFERNRRARSPRRIRRVEERRDANGAGERFGRPLLRRARAAACDDHGLRVHCC